MKKIFLIGNAHLDPIWQWDRDEGIGAALSTFRAAADFCEEYDGFVFNHNEVILYEWIREYEPNLFERIKKLTAAGKWHIMGGWYLQPDCNMPSGESFVRQIEAGRRYFKENFNAYPTVAINFDPFGHTKGLVQIMQQAGYQAYVVCRPNSNEVNLPVKNADDDFLWKGFNNSEIVVKRSLGYNSAMGKLKEKIDYYKELFPDRERSMILWGVGNHGGGPSREDLDTVRQLQAADDGYEYIHSTPEEYFSEVLKNKEALPVFEKDLNPCMQGCYTSQIRVKELHRRLENELFFAEKIASHAYFEGKIAYPAEELEAAQKDLMFAQFHDILPGSSIQLAEESALRILNHGLEETSVARARAFFALSDGEERAAEGEYPILVYNPHPFETEAVIETEFMLSDQNYKHEFSLPIVYQNGNRLPSQPEKENSNIPIDWRKKVVFRAKLKPMSINRFSCFTETIKAHILPEIDFSKPYYCFENDRINVRLNLKTGLLDYYAVDGKQLLKEDSCALLVMADNEDAWGFFKKQYDQQKGHFMLADEAEAADITGVKAQAIAPIRIIEDGEVRTVIEAVFTYHCSRLIVHYILPKVGSEIGISLRVINNEKDTMLKFNVNTTLKGAELKGKTAYGVNDLSLLHEENVAQEWAALCGEHDAVSIIRTSGYGVSSDGSDLQMTLLRSPGYCSHPIENREILKQDRFSERMEQGERQFMFYLNASSRTSRLHAIDFEAIQKLQQPYSLSFFPSGNAKKSQQFLTASNQSVSVTTIKPRVSKNGFLVRLFNSTDVKQKTTLHANQLTQEFSLEPYEIKTVALSEQGFSEIDLLDL